MHKLLILLYVSFENGVERVEGTGVYLAIKEHEEKCYIRLSLKLRIILSPLLSYVMYGTT